MSPGNRDEHRKAVTAKAREARERLQRMRQLGDAVRSMQESIEILLDERKEYVAGKAPPREIFVS